MHKVDINQQGEVCANKQSHRIKYSQSINDIFKCTLLKNTIKGYIFSIEIRYEHRDSPAPRT